MNFEQAIEAAKGGAKVSRMGWNGKAQYVVYMPALNIEPGMVNGRSRSHIGEGVGLHCQPYFVIVLPCASCDDGDTQNGPPYVKWQPGWLASQADMLADDWVAAAEVA